MADEQFDPVNQFSNLRDNLRDTLNKAVDAGLRSVTSAQYPPLDVYKTAQAVVVRTVPLDGIDSTSIDVSMQGKELTISGTTRNSDDVSEASYIQRERSFGTFSRTITIPVRVQSEKASAKLKSGVLTVTLPLADVDQSEVIDVQVAE